MSTNVLLPRMNVPNFLTLLRIVLIPVFVFVFYLPWKWSHLTVAIIFSLACITDLLDGFFARVLKQTSNWGAFLDPVADKLAVVVALVLLVSDSSLPYLAIPAAVIIGREIVISALREWMAELGKRTSVAVNFIGKIKTAIQMFSIIILLAVHDNSSRSLLISGYLLFYLAAALTIWSMYMYVKLAWANLVLSQDARNSTFSSSLSSETYTPHSEER